jgi:hypothetical protein
VVVIGSLWKGKVYMLQSRKYLQFLTDGHMLLAGQHDPVEAASLEGHSLASESRFAPLLVVRISIVTGVVDRMHRECPWPSVSATSIFRGTSPLHDRRRRGKATQRNPTYCRS